jgi:hypothetical protein
MGSRQAPVRSGYGGVVVIGRNVGSVPMPDTFWRLFINDVVALCEAHGGAVHTVANGVGEWDGVLEDSGVVVYGGPLAQLLHGDLALLAAKYGQDCIATVGGDNWLVWRAEEASGASEPVAQAYKEA